MSKTCAEKILSPKQLCSQLINISLINNRVIELIWIRSDDVSQYKIQTNYINWMVGNDSKDMHAKNLFLYQTDFLTAKDYLRRF